MKLKRFTLIAAFALLILIFARPSGAQAALKPSLIEDKVILYTDSEPYTFRFINLDSGAKVTFSSSKEAVIKIRDSKAVPLKKGKSTVTVKIKQNKKTYKFKVKFTVKNVPKQKTVGDYKKLADETIKRLKSELLDKKGAYLDYGDGTYCTSQKALDREMFKGLCKFKAFTVIVSDLKFVRSEEEYMDMFPFLSEITLEDPRDYSNCISLIVSNTKKPTAFSAQEIAVDFALSGGDVSFLNKSEKLLYKKIVKAAKKLEKDNVYDTVKAIHDHIIKKFEYETDETNKDRYGLESAIKTGKTVCSGYAKYFNSLCKALGINAQFVIGSTGGVPGDHGWNLVEIGHKWYGVDVTWDDGGKNEKGKNIYNYKYFLIADEDMKKDHTWEESRYPEAVSKDLGTIYINLEKYPVVNGAKDALAYIKDFATKFAASKSKQTKLEFRELTAGSEAFEAINKELNAYGSTLGVHWKDWKNETDGRGKVYKITLYKK